MANTSGILKSLAGIFGIHALGHVKSADEKGFFTKIDPATFSEKLSPKIKGKGDKKYAVYPDNNEWGFIHGGGFEGQDVVKDFVDTDDYRVANALYKLGYLAGVPDMVGAGTKGDFRLMGEAKGKKAKDVMKGSILLSSMADLYKAKTGKGLLGKNTDLSFSTDPKTGTPMLMYKKRF